jgi:hypothetical protein
MTTSLDISSYRRAKAADAGFAGVGRSGLLLGSIPIEVVMASAKPKPDFDRGGGPGWSRTSAHRFEVCRSIH